MSPGWQSAAERRNRKTWPHPGVGNVDPFPSPLTDAEKARLTRGIVNGIGLTILMILGGAAVALMLAW